MINMLLLPPLVSAAVGFFMLLAVRSTEVLCSLPSDDVALPSERSMPAGVFLASTSPSSKPLREMIANFYKNRSDVSVRNKYDGMVICFLLLLI